LATEKTWGFGVIFLHQSFAAYGFPLIGARYEASQLFNISRNTINLWCQRKAETGDVKPKPRQNSQHNGKISDWEKFQAFVKEQGEKTQSEMARLGDAEISQRTIFRALQKIGHTRKKNIQVLPTG
jgi:transposase